MQAKLQLDQILDQRLQVRERKIWGCSAAKGGEAVPAPARRSRTVDQRLQVRGRKT